MIGPREWLATLALRHGSNPYRRQQWEIFCNGQKPDGVMGHEFLFLEKKQWWYPRNMHWLGKTECKLYPKWLGWVRLRIQANWLGKMPLYGQLFWFLVWQLFFLIGLTGNFLTVRNNQKVDRPVVIQSSLCSTLINKVITYNLFFIFIFNILTTMILYNFIK